MDIKARIEIDDNLTFGDLYDFSDIARGSGIPRDALVKQVRADHHGEDLGLEASEVDVQPAKAGPPVTLTGEQVRDFVNALQYFLGNESSDVAGWVIEAIGHYKAVLMGADDDDAPTPA